MPTARARFGRGCLIGRAGTARRSLAVTGVSWGGDGRGDVAIGGDAEVDGFGATGSGQVGLGEFVVGGGEADLESFGFAGPAFALGFGDAGQEVVRKPRGTSIATV
jgi:hypothetical protein